MHWEFLFSETELLASNVFSPRFTQVCVSQYLEQTYADTRYFNKRIWQIMHLMIWILFQDFPYFNDLNAYTKDFWSFWDNTMKGFLLKHSLKFHRQLDTLLLSRLVIFCCIKDIWHGMLWFQAALRSFNEKCCHFLVRSLSEPYSLILGAAACTTRHMGGRKNTDNFLGSTGLTESMYHRISMLFL